MATFSRQSIQRLSTCHPDLQTLFWEVIKHFDCTVLEGHRNEADQEKAFKAGNTKLHYPYGNHNKTPSMAADVSPYPVQWDKIARFYWFAGYVLGIAQKLFDEGRMSMRVRYGGDWDSDMDTTDQAFNDLVHFELVPP